MLFLRTIISMVAFVIVANFELCFCGCARAEYEINGECCPMCAPGNRVYWHCTVDTSTTCVPCLASTFTDEPNGLTKCFPCTVCATIKGLKILKSCIRSENTLCGPQEGFYCIKQNKGSCELAVEHSKCQPGQYIKHTGTTLSDTKCVNCTEGTYSNGSVTSCLPHSKCEMMGLVEKKAGTTSSDAECEKGILVLTVGVMFTVLVVIVTVTLAFIIYRKHKERHSKRNVHSKSQEPTEDDGLCTLTGSGNICGPSEYESDAGECCPMCSVGSIIRSDCSGDSSTTCKPCPSGTFMNKPNGLHTCFPCRNCAKDQGLYIQSKCTTIQDSICDVLDDYYCIDVSNQKCSRAVRHSVCKAGQETKTQGTKTADTVCVNCTLGFYSPSGINCIKWTNCTAINEIQTRSGSSVKDVTCTPKSRERYGLICGFILAVVVTILFFISPFWFPPKDLKRRENLTNAVQETVLVGGNQ